MPIKLKNNAASTLATGIDDATTTVVVDDGDQFPTLGAGEYFYATLVSTTGTREIVKVTARSTDTLTVVRAQDGSTATTFQVGSLVEMRVNAASVTDLVDEHDQASEITIADAGGFFTATDVEAALQELALAETITIADAGGFFTATDVEAALQELALAETITIADVQGRYNDTDVEGALYSLRNPTTDTFTGDGVTVAFTLTPTFVRRSLTMVSVDGIHQHKSTYTVSGTTLTFTEAPPIGSAIDVYTR